MNGSGGNGSERCCVCLERCDAAQDRRGTVTLKCSHEMHVACFMQWATRCMAQDGHASCPVCRAIEYDCRSHKTVRAQAVQCELNPLVQRVIDATAEIQQRFGVLAALVTHALLWVWLFYKIAGKLSAFVGRALAFLDRHWRFIALFFFTYRLARDMLTGEPSEA